MPGIFGAYKGNPEENLSSIMEKIAQAMNHEGGLRIDQFTEGDKGFGFGRVSLGILNDLDQPITNPEGCCSIIFHGELYGTAETLTDPEYVLELYLKKGDECARELNGIFHFVMYDGRSKEIKLFSDKFGLQPLYYSVLPDGIVFGGEVKALLQDENVGREPDYTSIADFLHYGQILGQKTLFKDIKLLAPGSVLTFNLRNNRDSVRKYWHLHDLFVERGQYNLRASAEEAVALLVQSIKTRSAQKEILGLSLSGGLDSRGILAGLGKEAEGVKTYTLGLPGCADQKLAARIATAAKTKHEFVKLDESHLQDFESMAYDMIRLSDGMYHPHESTEMLALEYFKEARFKVLLRGHGGEIAKAALAYPVMVSPHFYSYSNGRETLAYIFNITNIVRRDIDPGRLFRPSCRDLMKEAPRRSLEESCGMASEMLAPADLCIYYYIHEHIRRQVVASLDIFRTQIEVRMPYVDESFAKRLFELPVSERNDGEIHFKLIQRCMPDLIKIPNSNTGAPLDAGAPRLFVSDKFSSLMKRLGVMGFRHYTEFQKWHRNAFRDSSQKIIFSEQTRERNLYDMDYLMSVFEWHTSGKKNYAHLLGTIVGLELWFRSFVD